MMLTFTKWERKTKSKKPGGFYIKSVCFSFEVLSFMLAMHHLCVSSWCDWSTDVVIIVTPRISC